MVKEAKRKTKKPKTEEFDDRALSGERVIVRGDDEDDGGGAVARWSPHVLQAR